MLFEINLRLFKREISQQLMHFPGTRVPGCNPRNPGGFGEVAKKIT
jgi:hypothetical protein